MPGARCARSLVYKKQTHELVTTVTPERPGIPRAMVYGLLRALPGDQACLTPSPALLIADLTPALGRQNDTTWPYASRPRSSRALPTSTASRPALMTCATPLSWDGTGIDIEVIWVCWQAKFLNFRSRLGPCFRGPVGEEVLFRFW